MKRNILALMSLSLIMLSSCGQKVKNNTSDEELNKANQVIQYTNLIIMESNKIHDWSESYQRYVETLIDLANDPKRILEIQNQSFFTLNDVAGFSQLETKAEDIKKLRAVSKVLTAEQQEFFTEKIRIYIDNKMGLLRSYKAIKDYLNKENYKDDKGELGKLYADSIKGFYINMFININDMVDEASTIGDEAELITLKSSPNYELILFLRSEMRVSKNMIAAIYGYNEGEVSKEEFETTYKEYEATHSKNKDIAKSNNFNPNTTNKTDYKHFNQRAEDLATEFIKANRSVKNNEKIDNRILSMADNRLKYLIDSYNGIIN